MNTKTDDQTLRFILRYNGQFEYRFADKIEITQCWSYYIISNQDLYSDLGEHLIKLEGEIKTTSDHYLVTQKENTLYLYKDTELFSPTVITTDARPMSIKLAPGILFIVLENNKADIYRHTNTAVEYWKTVESISPKTFRGVSKLGYFVNNTLVNYNTLEKYPITILKNDKKTKVSEQYYEVIGQYADDLIIFKTFSTTDICRVISYGTFELLWSSNKVQSHLIIDSVAPVVRAIYDLRTGSQLFSIANDVYPSVDPPLAVTRKTGGSGYIIWIAEWNMRYIVKNAILTHLKDIGAADKLVNEPLVMREIAIEWPRIDTTNDQTVIKSYIKIAQAFITSYNDTYPFPVYTYDSLYPYYHKKMLGTNITVIAFGTGNLNMEASGYTLLGHRYLKRYNARSPPDLETLRSIPKIQFLFADYSNSVLIKTLAAWIRFFLSNREYIRGSRQHKIQMIDAFTIQWLSDDIYLPPCI